MRLSCRCVYHHTSFFKTMLSFNIYLSLFRFFYLQPFYYYRIHHFFHVSNEFSFYLITVVIHTVCARSVVRGFFVFFFFRIHSSNKHYSGLQFSAFCVFFCHAAFPYTQLSTNQVKKKIYVRFAYSRFNLFLYYTPKLVK